ncbi:hypothetical protein [Streptococcus pyogenes]|uniref:hypothetical protein n=1 Tax=Streptococcus pyogenes TaxID=1314 RepID=UPI0039A59629
MKTKSKRFLNLATLCLALLGTTLLMEQPVKAQVVQSVGGDLSAEQEKIKNDYMRRLGLSKLTDQYQKNRFQGYLEGYENGQQPGAPEFPEKTERYDPDPDPENPIAIDGYGDGYGEGYADGYENRMLNGSRENREKTPKVPENSLTGTTGAEDNGGSQDQSQDQKEDSTGDAPVSDLLSVVGSLLTFVLSWFGWN